MFTVRKASVARKTNETDIQVFLTLDSSPGVAQTITVSTGIGFLDHVGLAESRLSESIYHPSIDAACSCKTWRNVSGDTV